MLKITIIAIVTINVLGAVRADDAEDLFQVIDSVLSPLVPIGNPETPLVEDADKIKKLCGLLNKDFINKQSSKVGSLLKGVSAKIAQNALDNFSADKINLCQLAKEGSGEKAVLIAKGYNQNLVEANKVRLSILTAVHELKQKGTKASLPTLTCYAKQFFEKSIAVYPEKDGVKEFVISELGHIFRDVFIKTLENESGKAADSCPMPEATANPSKFNSVMVALFNAVLALQDK